MGRTPEWNAEFGYSRGSDKVRRLELWSLIAGDGCGMHALCGGVVLSFLSDARETFLFHTRKSYYYLKGFPSFFLFVSFLSFC